MSYVCSTESNSGLAQVQIRDLATEEQIAWAYTTEKRTAPPQKPWIANSPLLDMWRFLFPSTIHDEILTGPILCRSGTDNHRCSEFLTHTLFFFFSVYLCGPGYSRTLRRPGCLLSQRATYLYLPLPPVPRIKTYSTIHFFYPLSLFWPLFTIPLSFEKVISLTHLGITLLGQVWVSKPLVRSISDECRQH